MTSIQPEQLANEVNDIRSLISEPPKLRSKLVEILEFYSDRTRRSQTSIRSKDAERKFGVPNPVMKALERGLKQSILENLDYASEISEELWEVNYREPRLLAIVLLEHCDYDAIMNRVEAWSLMTKDYEILSKLAETLVLQWGSMGYSKFSEIVTKWLKSKKTERRLLSLLTLQFVASAPDFEDIPHIFHLIRVYEISNVQKLRRAYYDLLRSLVQRSSAETARYLLDVYETHEQRGRRLIKELLPEFPSEEQGRLQRVLLT